MCAGKGDKITYSGLRAKGVGSVQNKRSHINLATTAGHGVF